MSQIWAERQRSTNLLARKLASYLFSQKNITARQIYGLSKLAWITKEDKSDAYIRSTKIPALGDLFNKDFSTMSLTEVAQLVANEVNDPSIFELIMVQSGFTNFYNAYRNSVLAWIEEHIQVIQTLCKKAYEIESELDRFEIVKALANLPDIPKANKPDQKMGSENFLTPLFFILDPQIKFPIINGRKSVQKLLKNLNESDSGLVAQYSALSKLIGTSGIRDAADLDQVGDDLTDFIDTKYTKAKSKLIEIRHRDLPTKDVGDIEVIIKERTQSRTRIHNSLTEALQIVLKGYTIHEGASNACMYDVMVKRYDSKGNDLLIEVKSTTEAAVVRMAVGQLYHYSFTLNAKKEPHYAILLPEKPSEDIVSFLKWMDIGLLWFEDRELITVNKRLGNIARKI